jgi:hypothetical protein
LPIMVDLELSHRTGDSSDPLILCITDPKDSCE